MLYFTRLRQAIRTMNFQWMTHSSVDQTQTGRLKFLFAYKQTLQVCVPVTEVNFSWWTDFCWSTAKCLITSCLSTWKQFWIARLTITICGIWAGVGKSKDRCLFLNRGISKERNITKFLLKGLITLWLNDLVIPPDWCWQEYKLRLD